MQLDAAYQVTHAEPIPPIRPRDVGLAPAFLVGEAYSSAFDMCNTSGSLAGGVFDGDTTQQQLPALRGTEMCWLVRLDAFASVRRVHPTLLLLLLLFFLSAVWESCVVVLVV